MTHTITGEKTVLPAKSHNDSQVVFEVGSQVTAGEYVVRVRNEVGWSN